MCDEPLDVYFRLAGIEEKFEVSSTALWRGYVGTWEILAGRLYLISLNGKLKNGTAATVATFFPNNPERVFAHWYSGALRLPRGKLLKYVHGDYRSVYEEDAFLSLDKGVVTHTEVRHNGMSMNPDASEGYRINAMTIFAQNSQSKGNEA